MSFVSGFNAGATGGAVNTIAFQAQALTGGSMTIGSTSTSTVTSPALITSLQGLTAAAGAATFGTDQVVFGGSATTPEKLTVTSLDAAGNQTQTVYTALDANGNIIDGGAFKTDTNIAALSATTTVTPPAGAVTSTTSTSTVTDAATVATLAGITASNATATASYGNDKITFTAGVAGASPTTIAITS